MSEFTAAGHGRIYVDGGQIVHSFIQAGLIKDMLLTTHPILIGDGLHIFGPLEQDMPVELVSTTAHTFGIVTSGVVTFGVVQRPHCRPKENPQERQWAAPKIRQIVDQGNHCQHGLPLA